MIKMSKKEFMDQLREGLDGNVSYEKYRETIEYYDECYPKVKKSRNSIDMLLDFKRQLNETII